jgi:hypothetical protein
MGKEAISNFEMPAAAGKLLAGKLKSEMRIARRGRLTTASSSIGEHGDQDG